MTDDGEQEAVLVLVLVFLENSLHESLHVLCMGKCVKEIRGMKRQVRAGRVKEQRENAWCLVVQWSREPTRSSE